MQYHWKVSSFGKKVDIWQGTQLVGGLRLMGGRKRCIAQWKGKKFRFLASGFWTVRIKVLDEEIGEQVAEVRISSFFRRVILRTRPGEALQWKYTSFLQHKWKWQNGSLTEVMYHARGLFRNRGQILVKENMVPEPYRVPLGLFVKAQLDR